MSGLKATAETGLRAGVPVRWRCYGDGPERALLLHCALAHSGAWKGLATRLRHRLTMLAPDMPSHGGSAPWDGESNLHDLVTAIAGSFVESPCHVIGHSFGATVAIRLAMERPSELRSLTLIEPVLFAAARETAPDVFFAYLRQEHAFMAQVKAGEWSLAARRFIALWGDGRPWDALTAREQDALAAGMAFVGQSERFLVEDDARLLRPGGPERISCPTLLLRGSQSPPIVGALLDGLSRRIAGAHLEVIEGAGHMLPISHPEATARAVLPHLDRAPGGRPLQEGGGCAI